MAQATHDSTSTSPTQQMSPGELTALAGRLRARADSASRNQPEQRHDLQAAAQVIDQLVQLHTEIKATAAVIDDLSRHLAIVGGH